MKMNIPTLMFLAFELLFFKRTFSLEITTCNCTQAENRGLLDLEPPDECKSSKLANQPVDAEYRVYTTDNPQYKFQGFTCVAWEEKKTIEGFFLGGFDTTFETITKSVTVDECKRMARFHECGGPNIKMSVEDGNYVYNVKPDCKGKYWSTNHCMTTNCVLSPVTLSQACANCSITSPYGKLTNNSEETSAIHGHRTFIWEPRIKPNPRTCRMRLIHSGSGRVNSIQDGKKERLVDKNSQLEFHYEKNLDERLRHEYCDIGNIYKISGVPETWIEVKLNTPSPEPWADQLIRSKSNVSRLSAWGAIKSGNIEACLLASYIPSKISVAACEGKRFQNFELTTEGMLRVNDLIVSQNLMYQTQTYCLTINAAGEIVSILCALEQKYARNPWLYNPVTKRLISSGLCLAVWVPTSLVSSSPTVKMDKCEPNRRQQDWYMEYHTDDKGKVIRHETFKNIQTDATPIMKRLEIFPIVDNNGTNDPVSLLVEHHQYTEGRAVERENILTDEIHALNCALVEQRKFQIISLAQTNGFLAAAAARLPTCQRLQAHGSALMVQTCKAEKANVTGKATACGIEPFLQNYTIGLDSYSLHPFRECFRKGNIVTLNGKPYIWQDNDWKETKANVKLHNIELVDKFEEIDDNESEYIIKPHDAYDREDQEQINIINDIISSMRDANSNAMQIVMDETSKSNVPQLGWPKFMQGFMKLIYFTLAAILSALLIKCLIDVKCCSRISKKWEKKMAKKQRPARFQNETQNEERVTLKVGTCPPSHEPPAVTRPKWNPVAKAWTFSEEVETAV